MKTKLMSLGSIIIHVVVCCCLLAATTGCSNSKDSANAQATQRNTVRNKLSGGAKKLFTARGSGSGASEVGNTFEEDGDPASGSGQQGERKDTEQDTGLEDLESLVQGLEDKYVESVCKKIVSEKHPFTRELARKMGFGESDEDAAKNFKKLLDDVMKGNIDRKRKFIEVIVINTYGESGSFKDNIDKIRKFVCKVADDGEVTVLEHKKGHKEGKRLFGTDIKADIESGEKKLRGRARKKGKNKYGDFTGKEFGECIPKLMIREEAKKKTVSAVKSVLNRCFTDLEWQKKQKKGNDNKQYFKSYNKEDKANGYTKENPYNNLNQAIEDMNSSK